MGNGYVRTTDKILVFVASVIAFILFSAAPLHAQQQQSAAAAAAAAAAQVDIINRTYALELNRIGSSPKNSAVTDQRVVIIRHVNEDFLRIQTLRNEMISAVTTGSLPHYDRLSSMASEVRKCADRLKANLLLPKPEDSGKKQSGSNNLDSRPMKVLLSSLSASINNFVTNPLFQRSAGEVNVQLSAKASNDLAKVIELSTDLSRATKKLNETSQKGRSIQQK